MTDQQLVSETLGSPYLLISGGFLVQKGGVFLSGEEVAKAKKSHTLVDLYFSKLRSGESYDWETAKTMGSLKRAEGAKTEEAKAEPAPEPAPDAKAHSAKKIVLGVKRSVPAHRVIPFVLIAVGIGAMATSVILSRRVQVVNAGRYTGTLLAFVMVAFESVAFTVAVVFWRRRKYPMSVLFVAMFCVVEFYSMSNTVQVFYASYEQTLADNDKDFSTASSVRTKINDINDQIKSKKAQIATQEQTIQYYTDHEWGVKKLSDDLAKMNTDLGVLVSNKAGIIDANKEYAGTDTPVKKETLFERVSAITGISDETLSMLLSCFPALFIDLIAPFSMAAAEGLTAAYKEEEDDNRVNAASI